MTTGQPNDQPDVADVGRATEVAVRRRGGAVGRVMDHLPAVIVLCVVAGIGFWGYRTGWKASKFSELTGGVAGAAKEDWCVEHAVPESRCIKCRPELVGASLKDWCPEHGLPESKCTICHPEILRTGVAGDWCPEHGLPESSCTLCHPEIAVKGNAPASESGARVMLVSGDGSTTVGPSASSVPAAAPATVPATARHDEHASHAQANTEDHPGDAHEQAHADGQDGHQHESGTSAVTTPAGDGHAHVKDSKTCQTHNLRVQFASEASVRKAGVKLAAVVERPMSATLRANAELQYNRNRFAQISSPVAGKVWRVEKEVGQSVKQGEVIALIDSAEVGRAKAELLRSMAEQELKRKTLERLKTSAESGLRTSAELQEADAAAKAAGISVFNAHQGLINLGLSLRREDIEQLARTQNIQLLGLPPELAGKLDAQTTTANLLPLTAPFDGIVIERHAVAGEVIEPTTPLLVVTDTSRMWVTADVPLTDAPRVAPGQQVTFRADGAPDQAASGKVTWISTAVDDQTRTVKVRAEVENPEGRLLAHTFGKANITIRQAPSAIALPSEAIQWEGCCHIAFVRLTDDIFQARKVKLGSKVNGFTEVLNGVLPGEVVVAEGSHVLKSEILKSALGAGCAEHH